MVDGALERLRLQESKMKRITQSEMTERMKELAERENMCSRRPRRPRRQLQDIYGDYVRRHNANVDILTERISGYVVHRLYLLKKIDELKKQQ